MINLLTTPQVREADKYTIAHRNMAAGELMENASLAFCNCFMDEFPDRKQPISVYCGTGNNGGDGLAIARLLVHAGYSAISIRVVFFNQAASPDFKLNLERAIELEVPIVNIQSDNFPGEQGEGLIIDALLGSGLNKPLTGNWLRLVQHLNDSGKTMISVDVPTGFPAEGVIGQQAKCIRSELTITFERPKINFFFPESETALARFRVVAIGLEEEFIRRQHSGFALLEETDLRQLLKPRKPFSHKGTYGHVLVIAGKKETMGAALLSSEASLYTGSGLTTASIPAEGLTALNARSPEIMAHIRTPQTWLPELGKFTAILAGPGLGTDEVAAELIGKLLGEQPAKLVLDADALTILSKKKGALEQLPPGTVLTPHMKEFDRLFGAQEGWWQRVQLARETAAKLGIVIVLKNRYTFIASPGKGILVNPTGSPSMATGGMGDVLGGMIVSFLAQGYDATEAALLGVYLHGLCGQQFPGYVCPARELTRRIPEVIDQLLQENNR